MGSVRDEITVCRTHGVLEPCPCCEFDAPAPYWADLCNVTRKWPWTLPGQFSNFIERQGIPCTTIMLDDVEAPLPTHFCVDMIRATVERWRHRNLINAGLLGLLGDAWPHPVSLEAFAEWQQGLEEEKRVDVQHLPQLGFGFDWLGLVVVRECESWGVTLLGPVEKVFPSHDELFRMAEESKAAGDPWSAEMFEQEQRIYTLRFNTPWYLVRGDAAAPDAQRKVSELSRWYAKLFEGKTVRTGRPAGTGQPVSHDLIDAHFEVWLRTTGKPPTQDDLRGLFGLSLRQFKARLAQLRREHPDLPDPWPPSRR